MKRIVFDIETEPFSLSFKKTESIRTKMKLAPPMRLACSYSESSGEYSYFGPHQAPDLIQLLQSADEVVSFNGKNFDILVLRRHYGLHGRVPFKGSHVDLFQEIHGRAGYRVSLDAAVRLNLGEKKHTNGRKMDALTLDELKVACRSDVSQTYRLFQQHVNGTLQIPARKQGYWCTYPDRSYGGVPYVCPSCHALDCLEEDDWDTDDMSDGQQSDYLAGILGSAECQRCGELVEWGF